MKNIKYINQFIHSDAGDFLPKLKNNSIDIVLTDPPYFFHKMDNGWNKSTVSDTTHQQRVTSLPVGMKFEPSQGKQFYKWYYEVSKVLYKKLKPGGFFFSFATPRLYHRMATAMEDAGFNIRDTFLWIHTRNQAKAMKLDYFIDQTDFTKKQKKQLKSKLKGYKTPKIKSCFEPIAVAQKPYDKTYLNNIMKHKVGLFNTTVKVGDNKYPSNILTVDNINKIMDKTFLLPRPNIKEKGKFNNHPTVKPLQICEHLIKLSAFDPNTVVLDPFAGSGTVALAAKNLGYNFIAIDSNKDYIKIAKRRLKKSLL